jgi:predicted ATPase
VRTDLPSGTVTFLFTDVEDSTKLLHELGADAYAEALAEHRRVIREASVAEGGVEVDTQGDAFFFAFPTAPGAVAAAEAMTAVLASGPIRVRAGLHTGTPLLAEEGYVGDDVHRAARIAAAGHGGQVLVSSTTATLVEVELTDLGEHRLKDLGTPERVYQLGVAQFPALKSLYRTNLPVPATSFLGRERELSEIAAMLEDSTGLLTLTGPGGTGKTRLAIHAAAEAADSFPDGLWWVPLSSLRDARLVTSAVAQALSVEEEPGKELAQSVAAHLGDKRALLILDNAEHLMPDVASRVAELRDVSGPTLLVTSRERLQLQGEHVYAVPSLADDEGVELFLARSRAQGSDVESSEPVAELCARLDNLPLALELAAARTIVFSPGQLLERLSQRLDLLKAGRDADARQQTLRATIEWSYDLLEPEEQRLFKALSVFPGSANFEAAEVVCAADPDTLQSLLDKSLVRRRDDPPRYWMLETIRELATEKLTDAAEDAALRRRHAEHYLAVAQSANLAADVEGPQRHDLVIPERDNMRAALTWAFEENDMELALELFVALENFWATSLPEEAVEWAPKLLGAAEAVGGVDPRLVARALRVQGGMQNMVGQLDAADASWERALELVRPLGEERAVAALLHRLSNTSIRRGDVERARQLAQESLEGHRRAGGFAKGETQALTTLAYVACQDGHLDRALELLHEARVQAAAAGFRWWESGTLANIGAVTFELGRLDEAATATREALALSHPMHDRNGIVYELRLLAEIEASRGNARLAALVCGAIETEGQRLPVRLWAAHNWARDPAVPSGLDPGDLAEGRQLSLDDAVALALEAT